MPMDISAEKSCPTSSSIRASSCVFIEILCLPIDKLSTAVAKDKYSKGYCLHSSAASAQLTCPRSYAGSLNTIAVVISDPGQNDVGSARILWQAIGRKYGKLGGKAAAKNMTPEERKARAKKASLAAARK
jgi:hypothetical protein